MSRFKFWLESLESQRNQELQRIWADTFTSLGLGGLSDEDAAQQSLSKVTFGGRNPTTSQTSVFKGKQAVRKRLENGQIFARLEKTGDPELRKAVEDTRRWLDTDGAEHAANASTTVSNLLQKLFGRHFETFIDSDVPRTDTAKAQVPPQPPKNDATQAAAPDTSMQSTPTSPNQPPLQTVPGQQPQAAGAMMPPQPNTPMPPKPAGAELGLF